MKNIILLLTLGLSTLSYSYSNMDKGGKKAKISSNLTEGLVQETINSGGYTYVKLKLKDNKEVWAAGTSKEIAKGDKIKFSMENPMHNFHSKTLNRTFKTIYFVMKFSGGSKKASKAKPHGKMQVDTSIKIAKVKGSKSVEEIFQEKSKLAGKTVKVKGKIVKYSPGILGKNWIHLQDGTGKSGTNDLVITTLDNAQNGDVVVLEGKIVLNKDIGSGYVYDVMIEDAKIAK